jgi:hypothetical protein
MEEEDVDGSADDINSSYSGEEYDPAKPPIPNS